MNSKRRHLLQFITAGFVAGMLLFPSSCTKDKGKEPSSAPPSVKLCDTLKYSEDIKPLVNKNCALSGCHNAGADLDWTVYDKLKVRADNGKIKTRVIDQGSMPPSGKLPQSELDMIQCWLDAGAPNN